MPGPAEERPSNSEQAFPTGSAEAVVQQALTSIIAIDEHGHGHLAVPPPTQTHMPEPSSRTESCPSSAQSHFMGDLPASVAVLAKSIGDLQQPTNKPSRSQSDPGHPPRPPPASSSVASIGDQPKPASLPSQALEYVIDVKEQGFEDEHSPQTPLKDAALPALSASAALPALSAQSLRAPMSSFGSVGTVGTDSPAVNMRETTLQPGREKLPKWASWTNVTGGDEFESYFRGKRPATVQEHIIPVCVPMYNEEADELVLTLQSIHKMQKLMRVNKTLQRFELKVCVIQDGYKMASESFKEAMRIMFPPSKYDDWEGRVKDAVDNDEKLTCVLQAPCEIPLATLSCASVLGDELGTIGKSLSGLLDITVVLKADNRKKTNSHDLFFRGFANHLNPEFVFATDCGTLFDDQCLSMLLKKIMKEKDCVAVTCRQRVMTKAMQPGCATEGFVAWMLRCVQGYDYEASVVLFNGCFSMLGCLAVVPGPCGLFRLPPLLEKTMQNNTESPFDFYIKAAARAEESKGMIPGNCMLAEDCVLTFAAEFLTKGRCKVRWAKKALFYFQAETNLKALVAQRRRWLNGTVAGYVFVHNELGRKTLPSSHPHAKVILLRTIIKMMLAMYGGIAIGPALYAYGLCESLRYLRTFHPSMLEGSTVDTQVDGTFEIVLVGIAALYFAIFALFSLAHHYAKFDPRLFALCGTMNAAAVAMMTVAMVMSSLQGVSVVQWFGFVYMVVPICLNLFIPNYTSLKQLCHLGRVLVFILFMPTMQGFFLTLSIARTFDLSWGNRAGIGAEEESLKMDSQALMTAQMLANFLLLVFLFAFKGATFFAHVQFLLALVLLTPMSLLTVGSAFQLLGSVFSVVGIVFATCLVLSRYGFADALLFQDGQEVIAPFLLGTPVLKGLALQSTLVVLVVVILKTIRHSISRCLVWRAKRRADAVREPPRRNFSLSGLVGGLRDSGSKSPGHGASEVPVRTRSPRVTFEAEAEDLEAVGQLSEPAQGFRAPSRTPSRTGASNVQKDAL